MNEEIKPCPFCGSDEVKEFKKVNQLHKVELFGVCCWDCGGESGISGIKEEAIQKWNQRPYDFDMPAIVKKVQQFEELVSSLIMAWDTGAIALWNENDIDIYRKMVKPCKQPE